MISATYGQSGAEEISLTKNTALQVLNKLYIKNF